MILFLLQLAEASQCMAQPATMSVYTDTLHTRGSFSVRMQGGAVRGVPAEQIGPRIRLRGADGVLRALKVDHLLGEVRFTPHQPLAEGSYTVELYADFDEHAQRLLPGSRVPAAWSAWFPYERVDVRDLDAGDLPKLEAPSGVQWLRAHSPGLSSAGPSSVLRAIAPAMAGVHLEIEVDGVGTVARSRIGTTGENSARLAMNMCAPYPVDLPTGGDLRVRAVSVGLDGARAAAAWTTLGPSTRASAPPRPPSGVLDALTTLHTWRPLVHSPHPGDTTVAETSCGTLVPRGEPAALELAPDEVVRADADQVLRRIRTTAGQLVLDGKEVGWVLPSREAARIYLAGAGDLLTLGVHDSKSQWLYVLRVRDGRVVEQAEVFGVTWVTSFELDGSELRVAWREGQDIRWVQSFGADLSPLGVPSEELEPIRVGRIRPTSGAGWGIGVNGHSVQALDLHHLSNHTTFEGRAYIAARANEGNTVAAVHADGTLAWTLSFEKNIGIRRIVVDARGVHLLSKELRGQEIVEIVRTFTHDGIAILPPLDMPAEVREPTRPQPAVTRRIRHEGRTVVLTQGRRSTLGFEENGVRSPEVVIARNAVVAVRPQGAEVVWTGRADPSHRVGPGEVSRTWTQFLECTGEAVGVPESWRPPAR